MSLDCRSYGESVLRTKVARLGRWSRINDKVQYEIHSELFESLLVLDLGLQLYAIPEEYLFAMSREFFSTLFMNVWTEGVQQKERNAPEEFVYKSESSEELRRHFPKFTRMIDQGIRGENYWKLSPIGIQHFQPLQAHYERFVMLHSLLVTDESVGAFALALRYSPSWDEYMQQNVEASDIIYAPKHNRPDAALHLRAANVFRGFISFIGYLGRMGEILDMAQQTCDESDAFRFSDRIRDILNWRLDFASSETVRRFEGVRKLLIEKAAHESPSIAPQVRKALEDTLDSVLGHWLEPA